MDKLQWKKWYRDYRLSQKEVWKEIPWYEWAYLISNLGNIKTSSWLYIKTLNERYIRVNLWKKNKAKRFYVHRLVATVFIWPSTLHVNHKDWNKYNNHVHNLEWVTRSENMIHAVKKLWLSNTEALKKIRRKIWQYSTSWELIQTFDSITDWATAVSRDISTLCVAIKRNSLSWWYYWKYL